MSYLTTLRWTSRLCLKTSLHDVQKFRWEEASGHGNQEHCIRARTSFCRYHLAHFISCFCEVSQKLTTFQYQRCAALQVVSALCGVHLPRHRRRDRVRCVCPLQVWTSGGAIRLRCVRCSCQQQDTRSEGEEGGVHPEWRQHCKRWAC